MIDRKYSWDEDDTKHFPYKIDQKIMDEINTDIMLDICWSDQDGYRLTSAGLRYNDLAIVHVGVLQSMREDVW